MIIRIILKNLYSFKEETEFNMLPGRQAKLNHHKYNIDDLEYLKISSIQAATMINCGRIKNWEKEISVDGLK